MTVLLTGGTGFIGSHMAAKLLTKNINFIVVDNLSNSNKDQLNKLEKFFQKKIPFYKYDICEKDRIEELLNKYDIESVIHFAGLKSLSESINHPSLYYENNVIGSKKLIELIKKFNIKKFIFSSSATVYGEPKYLPIDETHPLSASNPYGQNKIDIESIIKNDSFFSKSCSTKILRYFNPVGSFTNGIIGEIPRGVPNNLMPYLLGVVNGDYPFLNVYGDDYNTPDGTAIRDYIHVMDLVDAHYKALKDDELGIDILNVGSGQGYSVMQLINTFENINNLEIPYKIIGRRYGDVEICFADSKKIKKKLNWKPRFDLRKICKDAYNFSLQFK